MHSPTGENMTITTANGTRFSFDSLQLASAWRSNLTVIMRTLRNGIETSLGIFILNPNMRIACSFCTDTDTITFVPQGGVPRFNTTQNGTQFMVDNLCISFGR